MPPRESALLPAVLALFVLAVAAVGSGGNFPLSDDWAFAHVVRSLLGGRGFDFLPWTGASLVVQALYGALACRVTGFSHDTLRLTTVAMSMTGIAAMHALLRELGADRRTAAAGALTLALSPLWFHLSLTFMTDVPFAALSLVGAWLVVRGLARQSRATLAAAGAALAAAFLVRQHAVWIAAAAGLVAAMPSSLRSAAPPRAAQAQDASGGIRAASPLRQRAGDAAVVVAMPLLVATAWAVWALTADTVPLAVHNKIGEAAGLAPGPALNVAFRATATAGFLLLPWGIAARPRNARTRTVFAAAFALLAAAAVYAFVRDGAAMFYLSNVLGDFTVGAATTRDLLFLGRTSGPSAGAAARFALTVVSLASAASVLAALLVAPGTDAKPRSRPATFLLLALGLSAAGTLLQLHWYFDRYVLVLVPLAVASLVARTSDLRLGPAFAAATLALGAYGVAGTHDYLAWNRARWDLLGELERAGVDARRIDGGVEYNAERLAAELGTAPTDAEARRGQPADRKSWWWVVDDEYVIAFGPLDGYAEAASRRWTRWLPPGEGRVLALHRTTP